MHGRLWSAFSDTLLVTRLFMIRPAVFEICRRYWYRGSYRRYEDYSNINGSLQTLRRASIWSQIETASLLTILKYFLPTKNLLMISSILEVWIATTHFRLSPRWMVYLQNDRSTNYFFNHNIQFEATKRLLKCYLF